MSIRHAHHLVRDQAGVGFARKPPVFLKPGDVMEVDIERIGGLGNPVAAAASA